MSRVCDGRRSRVGQCHIILTCYASLLQMLTTSGTGMDIKERWANTLKAHTGKAPDPEAPMSDDTPASAWERDAAKRALDELFSLTAQYRSSTAYRELLDFTARFRSYSPFNALLVHVQMPGARFVAPPSRWLNEYGRRIKPRARPLVMLRPMGPVMFVFDVGDTEPTKHAKPLPSEVTCPFAVRSGQIGHELDLLVGSATRDGVRITIAPGGSQSAGSIRAVKGSTGTLTFRAGVRKPRLVQVPIRYELLVNGDLSRESRFATVVHELAHLYCGHLGTPNGKWWPDRCGLAPEVKELEAESVAYLVCLRAGIDCASETYLADYARSNNEIAAISLERVMASAGLVEDMSRRRMEPRGEG